LLFHVAFSRYIAQSLNVELSDFDIAAARAQLKSLGHRSGRIMRAVAGQSVECKVPCLKKMVEALMDLELGRTI